MGVWHAMDKAWRWAVRQELGMVQAKAKAKAKGEPMPKMKGGGGQVVWKKKKYV